MTLSFPIDPEMYRPHRGIGAEVLYTNHRGETAIRHIIPERIWLGATKWHPEKQWLLDAFDLDKCESRTFALKDLKEIQ